MPSADNLSKQFGSRSGPTKCRARSGYKLFDTLMVFLKEFSKKLILKRSAANKKACRILMEVNLWHVCAFFLFFNFLHAGKFLKKFCYLPLSLLNFTAIPTKTFWIKIGPEIVIPTVCKGYQQQLTKASVIIFFWKKKPQHFCASCCHDNILDKVVSLTTKQNAAVVVVMILLGPTSSVLTFSAFVSICL